MNTIEMIYQEALTLPEELQLQVLGFITLIKSRRKNQSNADISTHQLFIQNNEKLDNIEQILQQIHHTLQQ